jgi:predicted ribosome quality control (RQC) complex YloA/Tae2 family protein
LPDDVLEKIENLLTRELCMYNTLRTMVSRELEAIVLNNDMEELLSVLQKKQEVISQLQLLSDSWLDALPLLKCGEARGVVGFWEKLSALFPEEQTSKLHRILSETRSAAEDLMQAEKKVQTELENHVHRLRKKILQMEHGRSAVIGYTKMGGGRVDP